METTVVYRGYIGIVEKKLETTAVHWGYLGRMGKRACFSISCNLNHA